MEDEILSSPPMDTGTPADSLPPMPEQALPTPGEDPYPEQVNASIDPSDPIWSGTRLSSYRSLYGAPQDPQPI